MTLHTSSLVGLLLFCLTPFFTASVVHACTCIEPPPPSVAFGEADAVFAGTPVAVRPADAGFLDVEIRVSEVWKGPVVSTITIRTYANEAGCGYSFSVGQADLIYGYNSEGVLGANLCTRTRRLSEAGEDLSWLGEGVPVATEPGAPADPVALSPNFPNPFRGKTEVEVTLPGPDCATLRVYDLRGRLVRDVPQVACGSGQRLVEVDLGLAPAGTYILELQAGESVERSMMTLAF